MIDPCQYQTLADCIRSGQVQDETVPKIMAENSGFAKWYAAAYPREEKPMNRMIRFFATALLCLFATEAFAAGSTLSVSEYQTLGATASGGAAGQMASEPAVTDQPLVDFSGGVASSAAFNAATRFVRISCSIRCAVKFGASGSTTATTANKPLGADAPEYFGVLPGNVISVIASP